MKHYFKLYFLYLPVTEKWLISEVYKMNNKKQLFIKELLVN